MDSLRQSFPQFIAIVWKSLCKQLGIKAKLSTAFCPETDGQTERTNQEVEAHLRAYCNHFQDDWSRWLPMAEFAKNNVLSSATGLSPFYANKGFDPSMTFSPDETHYDTTHHRLDAARAGAISNYMKEIVQYISQNLERAREAMARQAEKHRSDVEFKEGDLVFLSTKNLKSKRPSRKLDHKYEGPFKVIE